MTTKQVFFESVGGNCPVYLVTNLIVSISNLKNISKMSALPLLGKISVDAHQCKCDFVFDVESFHKIHVLRLQTFQKFISLYLHWHIIYRTLSRWWL